MNFSGIDCCFHQEITHSKFQVHQMKDYRFIASYIQNTFLQDTLLKVQATTRYCVTSCRPDWQSEAYSSVFYY